MGLESYGKRAIRLDGASGRSPCTERTSFEPHQLVGHIGLEVCVLFALIAKAVLHPVVACLFVTATDARQPL